MKIDWGALLPAQQAEAPAPVQTHAPGTNEGGSGGGIEAGDDGGRDRRTAEALATAEGRTRERATVWAARAGDDRRYCPECGNYRERRCVTAKPGGLVSAARGYEPVPDILRRCERFAPLPDDPDQRPGVERFPWLMQPPFRAALPAPMARRQPAQSPSGRASG